MQIEKWKPASQFQFILYGFCSFSSLSFVRKYIMDILYLILKRDDNETFERRPYELNKYLNYIILNNIDTP